MKYLKYTLLLIILLTFVSVHAETCTYEEKQKLAENIDLTKLKLTYVKEKKDGSGGIVKAEMNLDEYSYATLYTQGYKQLLSHGYYAYVYENAGGIGEIEVFHNLCSISKYEFFIPYYNLKNKFVFDDGSKVSKINTRISLIACTIILVISVIFLTRRCIKYEKI